MGLLGVVGGRGVDFYSDGGAVAGLGFDGDSRVDEGGALAHAGEAVVASCWGRCVDDVEAFAVVGDGEGEGVLAVLKADGEVGG